jgi:hypothetical protein
VPDFIDPVFAKTSPKLSFSIIENELFELENWFYKFGHGYNSKLILTTWEAGMD